MSIAGLKKKVVGKTLGIDCSTRSLAFAIFDGREPLRAGEIFFEGGTVFERLKDAHEKVPALMKSGILEFNHICFEGAILVGNNSKTGISLAYVYGAVMGGLMDSGVKVRTVAPLTWQAYIGNPNLKKAERDAIKLANPNRSASWYQNAGREVRKQKTLAFSRQFFEIPSDSDNIGDAVGIAWYAVNNPES